MNGNVPKDFPLEEFDVVILHYSVFLAVDAYVSPRLKKRLQAFKGVKCIFLQDEYRFVNETLQNIKKVGFDIIFTCVPENEIENVYPQHLIPKTKRINVLTGYVPEELLTIQVKELSKRKYDVSYRGRKYPAWHGQLGLEKWVIADNFLKLTKRFSLKTNISYKESDRLYGHSWVNLLCESKAVLGVESGASVFDFTGEISSKVEVFESLMPDYPYEKIKEKFFTDQENSIGLAQISPRIFEAIALRTACILYEGRYSGVLEPWRHYIPLKKDHSNIEEVVNALRNDEKITEIIACAYAEIALNKKYSYQNFVNDFDDHIEAVAPGKERNFPNLQIEKLSELYPFYFMKAPYLIYSSPLQAKFAHTLKRVLLKFFNRTALRYLYNFVFKRGV